MVRQVRWQLWLQLVIAPFQAWPLWSQEQRPMVVDDLFSLEQLGPVALSPDGEWLAAVIVRARTGAEIYRDFPFDVDHADIWLISRRDSGRRNITNGYRDGSGYWNPVWSPNGKRLALLSTEGGGNVRPYVYDLTSGTLRRLTERGADLDAYGDDGFPYYPMIWRDNSTLLCPVRAAGAPPSYWMTKTRSLSAAVQQWKKAEGGKQSTASVLESGREVPETERSKGALILLEVVSGRSHIVAEGNFRQLLLSPTRQYLALLAETGRIHPQSSRRLPYETDDRYWDLRRTRLGILSLTGAVGVVWVDDIVDPKPAPVAMTHTWSPDGSSFAVVSKAHVDDERAAAVFLVTASSGAAHSVTSSNLEVLATAWSGEGDLLALARPGGLPDSGEASPRADWWLIGQRQIKKEVKLTGELQSVPSTLVRTIAPGKMLGIVAGKVHSIDIHSRRTHDLSRIVQPELHALEWPSEVRLRTRAVSELVVRCEGNELLHLTIAADTILVEPVPRPSASATLIEFRPEQQLAVFTAAQANGTFLWIGNGNTRRFELRLSLNEQLAQIADPRRVLFEYRGTEGDSLKALLILPLGYAPGQRYPLVTYIYAGFVVADTVLDLVFEKALVSSLNLHLLPAHGYAVLIPSIPLQPPTTGSDPYTDLPKGIIGAVDRAIDLGIADPQRLAVMGHSYGGYSTYALITYTHRFRAAVSLAGLSNLVSLYGTFSAPLRYDEYVHEDLFQPALAESGQVRMGNTPWGDLWRYLRNSPVYYADRVRTPLMIIQGDIDYVPIQQGEEFFTALYRLGRKATFVRYWGEGHVISSPANVRDMWQRILAWFDENLKGDQVGRVPAEAVRRGQ